MFIFSWIVASARENPTNNKIKDLENNPLVIQHDYHIIAPHVPKDAYDLLLEGPVHPNDIHAVILSHLHFDHTGDVTRFPSAKIIAGAGSQAAPTPGWPKADFSPFDSTVVSHPNFHELPSSGPGFMSLAPFLKAFDYFGDGSFYLVDAPGHMAGHQIGLAMTGENEWVVMGGDCCHHKDLLDPGNVRTISVKDGPNGQPGFHKDACAAVASIEKLKTMGEYSNVLTVLAHDASLQGKIPLYPQSLNGWMKWKKF
jgi:glyoxylase-like metal-dependent hydrolase (beta-lactamase superfamily II)